MRWVGHHRDITALDFKKLGLADGIEEPYGLLATWVPLVEGNL
jgi:hypothetical protein